MRDSSSKVYSAPFSETNLKSLLSTPEIVLIAVTIVAIIVIAGIFVFITFNHLNINQANSSNQTNFSSFIFKIHEGKTENAFSALDLFGKASFITGAVSSLQHNNRLSLPAY
jgi:hypothetical protein